MEANATNQRDKPRRIPEHGSPPGLRPAAGGDHWEGDTTAAADDGGECRLDAL